MELHVTSTIRLYGVHTNRFTFSVKNPYKISVLITHAMTKHFDLRMHCSGHHDMKHPINRVKTLVNPQMVFLITLMPNYFTCSCPKFLRFLSFWLPFVFALIPVCAKCSGKSHQTSILLKTDVACGWSLNSPAPYVLKCDGPQRYSELYLDTVPTLLNC